MLNLPLQNAKYNIVIGFRVFPFLRNLLLFSPLSVGKLCLINIVKNLFQQPMPFLTLTTSLKIEFFADLIYNGQKLKTRSESIQKVNRYKCKIR